MKKDTEKQKDLEQLCRNYSQAHSVLARKISDVHEEIGKVKRRHLYRIKASASMAARLKSELLEYVGDHLDEFEKPRSRTFHGVKVGLQKGRGKVVCANKNFTIRAIERRHPELVDVLLKTTRTPLLRGLQQLEARQLAALGVEIVQTGSKIIVRHVDSEIEKMIDAYMDDEALQEEVA